MSTNNSYKLISREDMNIISMRFLQDNYPKHATSNMQKNLIANIEAFGGIPSDIKTPCWLSEDEKYSSAMGWFIFKNQIVNIVNMAKKTNGTEFSDSEIIREHTPLLFSTYSVGYDYNPEAECPKFKKYLEDVQPDLEGRKVLQAMFGYSLIPETKFNVAFFLYGEGGTGKSVCLHILKHLVGKTNTCCVPLARFKDRFSTYDLTTKLLNIVGDMPTDLSESFGLSKMEGMFKDITDGGTIQIERKFCTPVTAQVTARCIFATNSLPHFSDRSNAIWSRMRIIPFNVVFRDSKKMNPNLKDEIVSEELPGIMNWAIEGLADLEKRQTFPENPEGMKLKEEHRLSCNPERLFLEETCVWNDEGKVSTKRLYSAYQNYCKESGFRPRHQENFNRAVLLAFPKARKARCSQLTGNPTVWYGIKFTEDSVI